MSTPDARGGAAARPWAACWGPGRWLGFACSASRQTEAWVLRQGLAEVQVAQLDACRASLVASTDDRLEQLEP
jgi:hypothetical protein